MSYRQTSSAQLSAHLCTRIRHRDASDAYLLAAKLEVVRISSPETRRTEIQHTYSPPVQPFNPIFLGCLLEDTATAFMKEIWRPHILDRPEVPEKFPFQAAALALKPYWHFIFIIMVMVSPNWYEQSYHIYNFVFGQSHFQQVKMGQIAARYEVRFREQVDAKKATFWLHDIIEKSQRQLLFQEYNLDAFGLFYSSVHPMSTDPAIVEYLLYLKQDHHHDLLDSWYRYRGKAEGIKSIQRLLTLKEYRWGNILRDDQMYSPTVIAVCAFEASVRNNDEMHREYCQIFASCMLFAWNWFTLLQSPKREVIVALLDTCVYYTALKERELANIAETLLR